ncbi:MAG: hypothetical protein WBW14_02590, partial [Candidatus Acidiferrum sp.]
MAIMPIAGPNQACGNRSRLVDFSPAIDRSLLPRFVGTNSAELEKNPIRAEEKECGLASRLRAYGPQRSVLVNVVAEGFWQ